MQIDTDAEQGELKQADCMYRTKADSRKSACSGSNVLPYVCDSMVSGKSIFASTVQVG